MKENEIQLQLKTEKQHLILKLRLAMAFNRYDMLDGLNKEILRINSMY
jgi:uncharacterized protein YehS (DUF1456 family)